MCRGRQTRTQRDLEAWQQVVEKLLRRPDLADAAVDSSRVWNLDETSVQLGAGSQRILAPPGSKTLYTVSSGSRDHITASYTASASGALVPPLIVHKGKRKMADQKLRNLAQDGRSGKWQFEVSAKGFMNRDLFLKELKRFSSYLDDHEVQRPVILYLDGATSHISMDVVEYCEAAGIQPILIPPNMTHILQPLDITFFSSLKATLTKKTYDWQCNPINVGQSLNRYSVVTLLHQATELTLTNPNILAGSFKRSGLYPWNTAAPDRSRLKPGEVFSDKMGQLDSSSEDDDDIEEQQAPLTGREDNTEEEVCSVTTLHRPPRSDTQLVEQDREHVEEDSTQVDGAGLEKSSLVELRSNTEGGSSHNPIDTQMNPADVNLDQSLFLSTQQGFSSSHLSSPSRLALPFNRENHQREVDIKKSLENIFNELKVSKREREEARKDMAYIKSVLRKIEAKLFNMGEHISHDFETEGTEVNINNFEEESLMEPNVIEDFLDNDQEIEDYLSTLQP